MIRGGLQRGDEARSENIRTRGYNVVRYTLTTLTFYALLQIRSSLLHGNLLSTPPRFLVNNPSPTKDTVLPTIPQVQGQSHKGLVGYSFQALDSGSDGDGER